MTRPRTVEECKTILVKLAIKYGVPPRLISERLLSDADKKDMLDGELTLDCLDWHVKTWKEYGMCNYADGTGKRYSEFNKYVGVGKGSPEKVATIANLPHRN